MEDNRHQKLANAYADLMQEVKERLMNVLYGLQGNLEIFPPVIRQEFFSLQIRMSCEAIALACLVAHGDIANSKKIKKIWNADQLMNALTRLNKNYYPDPIIILKNGEGAHHVELNSDTNFLNKKDFLKLYHSLGQTLHRGTMESMHLNFSYVNFAETDSVVKKLCNLLQVHKISLPESKMHIICEWGGKEEKPRVYVAV